MALALVAMTAAILVGVRYGVVGMCLAWAVAYPGVFGVITWRSLRSLGMSVAEFGSRCVFPAVASVSMAAGVVLLRDALAPFGVSVWRLGVLIGAGAMLYVGAVLLFQRVAVRQLLGVVRG
jgi:hypothetical protein